MSICIYSYAPAFTILYELFLLYVVAFQSHSCVQLCDPMDCNGPGFHVLHSLPELAPTHVHWFGNAIWPSHALSPPSPPVLNLTQHQGLFQWVGSSHQVAKTVGALVSASVLPMNIQGWFSLGLSGLISMLSQGTLKKLLQHNSKASIFQWSAFIWSSSHISTWLLERNSLDYTDVCHRFGIAFLPRSKGLYFPGYSHHQQWFWSQENKISLFPLFPHLFVLKWLDWMPRS